MVLVDVGLRQFEGVLNQLQMRIAFFRQENFDDIKTENDIGIAEQPEPGQAAFRDAQLFLAIHRFDRSPKFFATTRFHFHKDQCVALAAHDIDLATAAIFKISVENFVAMAAQKSAGEYLAADTAPEMFR